jgi:glycosyltransferase 2 family protein
VWSALADTFDLVASVPLEPVLLATLLYATSLVLTGWRWQLVLRAMRIESRLVHTALGILGSIFVNNVTPVSRLGGEAYRVAYISTKEEVGAGPATASVALDRCADLLPFGLVFLLALPAAWPHVSHTNHLVLGAGITLGLMLTLVLAYRMLPRVQAVVARLKKTLSLAAIDRSAIAWALVPASLAWFLDLSRLQILASTFGISLDLPQAATLSVLASLGGLVPILGGTGAVEGGMTAGLLLLGVPLETALAITVLERSISFVLATLVGGCAALAHGGGRLSQLVKSTSSAPDILPRTVE